MNDSVFFSFLISVYNGGEYLIDSLDSIKNQTFRDFEVVIVDDGSTDRSLEIIEQFKKDVGFTVKVITHVNIGLTKSLNVGIEKCSGKYVVRQDADDLSKCDRLMVLHKHINEKSEFICSKAVVFGINKTRNELPSSLYNYCPFSPSILAYGNLHIHGSFCIKRAVLEKYRYNEVFKCAQDFDLLARLVTGGVKMEYLPVVLYSLRISESSISARNSSTQDEMVTKVAWEYFGGRKYGVYKKAIDVLYSTVSNLVKIS